MASKRWDLCVSHKDKNDKWRSSKVGVIFEGDKGQLNIKIDPGVSISTPDGVNLTGWEPKERESDGGRRDSSGRSGSRGGYEGGGATDGDNIPFDRIRGEI